MNSITLKKINDIEVKPFISKTSSSSNFNIDLGLSSDVSSYDRVCLGRCSIPRSWFDVEAPYNTFYLQENSSTVLITITVGMYNVNTLKTAIAAALTLSSPNSLTYTCYYPNAAIEVNTNKFRFECLSNNALSKKLIFTDGMYQQLGFEKGSTNSFVGSNTELYSTNSISISYINRLFLKSNICEKAHDQMLSEILIAGNFQSTSFVYFENTNYDVNSREFTNPVDTYFSFGLYDRYGNIVNLQGLEMVFSLILFKKNATDKMLMEDLKINNLEKLTA